MDFCLHMILEYNLDCGWILLKGNSHCQEVILGMLPSGLNMGLDVYWLFVTKALVLIDRSSSAIFSDIFVEFFKDG